MALNPNIILSGRRSDSMGSYMKGTQAASARNQLKDQNALRSLYAEHGAGIAAGDGAAINALAGLNPQAALGAQDAHLSMDAKRLQMDATRQRMAALSAQQVRAVQSHAAKMSAVEIDQQKQQITQGLLRGAQFYESGDLGALNMMLTEVGEQPLQSIDEFPSVAARYQGVLEVMERVRDFNSGPEQTTAMQTLAARAQAGGLQPGTPEYAQFMIDGGSAKERLRVTTAPDGSMTFEQGPAGSGGASKPPNERQSTLSLFGGLMDETMPSLNNMEDDPNFDPTSIRTTTAGGGVAGNLVTTPEARKYEALKRQWAEGVLRIQTGAAATQPEIERVMETYFPRLGDDPATVAQKRVQRDAFARSLSSASGGNITAPGGAGDRQGLSPASTFTPITQDALDAMSDEELQAFIDRGGQ